MKVKTLYEVLHDYLAVVLSFQHFIFKQNEVVHTIKFRNALCGPLEF